MSRDKYDRGISNKKPLLQPTSLRDMEDADDIWEIITQRLPKTAPLLCELEEVINKAQHQLGKSLKTTVPHNTELNAHPEGHHPFILGLNKHQDNEASQINRETLNNPLQFSTKDTTETASLKEWDKFGGKKVYEPLSSSISSHSFENASGTTTGHKEQDLTSRKDKECPESQDIGAKEFCEHYSSSPLHSHYMATSITTRDAMLAPITPRISKDMDDPIVPKSRKPTVTHYTSIPIRIPKLIVDPKPPRNHPKCSGVHVNPKKSPRNPTTQNSQVQ